MISATVTLVCGGLLHAQQEGTEPSEAEATVARPAFDRDIAPFLQAHCTACHGDEEPEAGLDLSRYRDSANIQDDFEIWEKILRMLVERQMPPEGEPRPPEPELQAVAAAVKAELARFDCRGQRRPGRVTIRRLNRAEYNNTIRDLLGVDFRPADDFPSDDVGNGFDNIGDVLSIPPLLLEKYLAAATEIIDRAFADEKSKSRILAPGNEVSGRGESARRVLGSFALRAYRRPVEDDELQRLYGIVREARRQDFSDEEALKTALQAILASPHFLFRVESDGPEPDGPETDGADEAAEDGVRRLNGYELASRLSYYLWSSMPDEELFRLASDDSLRRPEVLREQVARMLRDPRIEALTRNFAGQWLQLRSLANITPDPEMFPEFDPELREAMLRETETFFATVVREDRSVLDFLNADYTFVNGRLARHYGMEGVEGDEFRRVRLSDRRRGVLTHGSILLLTSNPTRTSPVKRGKWILDNVLGEPPSPPPDGVEALDEDAETLGSLRQRMEQHRSNEACAVCHRKMDALGFGLENFDVVGAWRDRDGRFEIDPSGTLPGDLNFKDANQLMQILAGDKKDDFSRCLAEKMLTYALGRGLQSYDRCAVDEILKQLSINEYRFSALVTAIVTSDPFTLRETRRQE